MGNPQISSRISRRLHWCSHFHAGLRQTSANAAHQSSRRFWRDRN